MPRPPTSESPLTCIQNFGVRTVVVEDYWTTWHTGTAGFDNQIAAQMAHAHAHCSDSHSRAWGLTRSQSFRGHFASLIINPYVDRTFFALNSKQRGLLAAFTVL